MPPSGFTLDQTGDTATPASTDGQDTTVVVLDTGYQLDKASGMPSQAVACGSDHCAPKPAPLYLSSKVASAIQTSKNPLLAQASRVVQESDMQLQTDFPEPGSSPSLPLAEFFDSSGNPVTIVDHGLFISGQIHQAAPAAKIVLVRVLNDYGVGDLRSILTGVNTVAYHPDQLGITSGSIVVNMSLGFGPSASCLVGTYHGWLTRSPADDERQNLTNAGCGANAPAGDPSSLTAGGPSGTPGAYAALTLPLSVAISHLANAGADQQSPIKAVVAAAGNESNGSQLRLDADLPAGICGVVPVAALKFSSATSSAQADFSNNASVGTNQCLQIDASSSTVTVSLQGETHSASAVGVNDCGLYLQPIPSATLDGTTSTAGSTAPDDVAYWNGTSFAAGWTSGYIARAGMPSGSSFTVPDVQQCNFA